MSETSGPTSGEPAMVAAKAVRLVAVCCAGVLLSGCYLAHGRDEPVDAAAARDAGRDAGFDAGFDAAVFEPPPGVCSPEPEWARDRFAGDTQALRDIDHATNALFSECSPGEGCARAEIEVGRDGRVDGAVAAPSSDTPSACIEAALLGLCLPTLVGAAPTEVTACGI